MLIGLVTKNGILIVEFANQRKATGLSKNEAVISAAASRLRPILHGRGSGPLPRAWIVPRQRAGAGGLRQSNRGPIDLPAARRDLRRGRSGG